MSDPHSPHGFDTVRRGYERAQVDERISKLIADRDSALARITALEKRIEELHLETQNAQAQVTDAEPSYAGLGARVEKILRLAEEEAKDLREEARRAAEQHRELARSGLTRIAGVSCNPATFARDARILTDGGFTLIRVLPVDQFLWSPHVELVGLFERSRG